MMIDDISSLSICLSVQSFNERRTTWTKHNAQRTAIITMKSSMSSRPVALPSLPLGHISLLSVRFLTADTDVFVFVTVGGYHRIKAEDKLQIDTRDLFWYFCKE